jgi:predicted dehydrogenase
MTELKVGVVGVGHLGRHHARILASLPGVRLVGVADTRIEQARAVAEAFGTTAFAEYRALLDRVDAVSIAVPTSAHRAVAGAFLERGIPTLVEKPLASNLAEADELVALARTHGALVQVGHIERFNPVLDSPERPRLRPRYVAAERLSTYTFRSTDIGVVLDLMIHDIDLMLSMVEAPVAAVSAVGTSIFGGHEDVASARLWFEDGTVADLSASRASLHAVRKMRLWGEDGYLGLDFKERQGLFVRPSEALRRGTLSSEGIDLTKPEALKAHLFGNVLETRRFQAEAREPLLLELEDFVSALRNGTRPRVSGDDALRAMQVADLVLRSLASHRWDGAAGPSPGFDPAEPAIRAPHVLRARSARTARHPGA